jgi:ribonuclease BN (tRNA processing enzyme)
MRVTLVPSAVGVAGVARQFLTSYLLDDTVAIDAGSLGLYRTPRHQARVKHLFVTHTHLDHLASLPMFLENAYRGDGDCVTIYGSAAVLDCLRGDLFNDRLWPDFIRISAIRAPYLKLREVKPGEPVECDGLRLTPVPVDHVVPTLGLIVEGRGAAVAIPSDTGPTEEIWERANRVARLKAVFLEATFPNSMGWLATLAKHLTPALFGEEARKVKKAVRFIAVHLSPRARAQIVKELKALDLPDLEIGRPGKAYSF